MIKTAGPCISGLKTLEHMPNFQSSPWISSPWSDSLVSRYPPAQPITQGLANSLGIELPYHGRHVSSQAHGVYLSFTVARSANCPRCRQLRPRRLRSRQMDEFPSELANRCQAGKLLELDYKPTLVDKSFDLGTILP